MERRQEKEGRERFEEVFAYVEDMYRVVASVVERYVRKVGIDMSEGNILAVAEMLSEELGEYEEMYGEAVKGKVAGMWGVGAVLAGVGAVAEGRYRSMVETFRREMSWYGRNGEDPAKVLMFAKNPLSYVGGGAKYFSLRDAVHTGSGTPYNIFTALRSYVTDFIVGTYNVSTAACARGSGMGHYYAIRGSSYDCPLCDSYCGVVMPLTDMVFPVHSRCCCIIIPVD